VIQGKEMENASSLYSVFITRVQEDKIWMLIDCKFTYKLDKCIVVIQKLLNTLTSNFFK